MIVSTINSNTFKNIFSIKDELTVMLSDGDNDIIYKGFNVYGSPILGIVILDNDDKNCLYYFHLMVTSEGIKSFLERSITLLDLMKLESTSISIVEKSYTGYIYDIRPIDISGINQNYLPLTDSYFPKDSIFRVDLNN